MYVTEQFASQVGEYEGTAFWNVTPCVLIK